MKKSIRIIILFATLCAFVKVDSSHQKTLRESIKTPPTNLDLFIDDISTLVSLTEGILQQSKLSQDFVKETSRYFHANSEKFGKFYKLNIDSVTQDISNFYEKIQTLNLKSNFEELIYPVQILSFLAIEPSEIENSINKTSVDEYSKTIESLKTNAPNLEPPSFGYLFFLKRCLEIEIEIWEVKKCFKDMMETDKSVIIEEFKALKKLRTDMNLAQKLVDGYRKIQSLEVFIIGAFQFSKSSQDYETLSTSLKSISTELFSIKSALDGKNKRVARRMKSAVFGPEVKYDGRSREVIDAFLKVFDSKWLKIVVGEKILNKLKTGLNPFLSYAKTLTNIGKTVEELRSHQELAIDIHEGIKSIESWREPYVIDSSLIDTIQRCVQNLQPVKTFAFSSFVKTFNYTKVLVINLENYLKWIDEVTDTEDEVILGLESLHDELNSWKQENLHQTQYNLASLLSKNGSKEIQRMMEILDFPISQMWEAYKKTEFKILISDHPDTKVFRNSLENVNISSISSISKCFFERNFAMGKLNEILDGADNVKKFKEEFTENDIKSVKSYMAGVSKILKMLKSAENELKRSLNPESKRLNEFSNVDDVMYSLIKGKEIMEAMSVVQRNESLLKRMIDSNLKFSDHFWKKWESDGRNITIKTIREVKNLDKFIKKHRNSKLQNTGNVFKEAARIQGLVDVFNGFDDFRDDVRIIKEGKEITEIFATVENLDLDFSSYSDKLHYASVNIGVLSNFLNEFLSVNSQKTRWKIKSLPVFQMILIIIGALSSIFCLFLIGYSTTKNGRKRWRRFYLERFASEEKRELQWRYSFWTDQESDRNSLCEAIREINLEQVKTLINKGVYINVYNHFGNTPLHAAAKYGHVKIAEILIKNGADRQAFNVENKTPEQLLSESVQTTIRLSLASGISVSEGTTKKSQKTEAEKFSEIEKIFEKHRKRKYRQRIPDLLPTMAFRIRIDNSLIDETSEAFTELYKGNVTDQMSGVTHFIVQTDGSGIFESNDFGYIMCVFLPTLMMKKQWMSACLEKKSNFRNDYKFRVEKVKYKGIVYETVLKWADWIHKQRLPFLFGVHIHVSIDGMSKNELIQLRQLVEMHGATWSDEMLVKENFNIGSHPFHHFNLGPLFILHDGKKTLQNLKNDPDKMFTLLTFDQFVIFMLKLECHYDPKRNVPIPVMTVHDNSE